MPQIRRIRLVVRSVLLLTGLANAITAGAQPNRISTQLAPASPCCTIVSIDANSGLVEARVNSTGQLFDFTLANRLVVGRLRAGQGIYANLGNRQVSLDGKTVTGTIVRLLQPGRTPQNNLGGSSGSSSTGSSSGGSPSADSSTGGSSSAGSPSVDSSALTTAQTVVSMLAKSRTAVLAPQCGQPYTVGCPNGTATPSSIQLARSSIMVTSSGNGSAWYPFSASMSAVTTVGIPVTVSGIACILNVNTAGSSPLSISGTLNITANTSGHTPIYKVSLSSPATALAPADFALSDCIGGEVSAIPPMFGTYLNGALFRELFGQWLSPVCFKSEHVVRCPT